MYVPEPHFFDNFFNVIHTKYLKLHLKNLNFLDKLLVFPGLTYVWYGGDDWDYVERPIDEMETRRHNDEKLQVYYDR